MLRCDFSSAITVLYRCFGSDYGTDQIELMYQLFASFVSSDDAADFSFDNGSVCRWINGQARISPRISGYYMADKHQDELADDIQNNIIPKLTDSAMCVKEIYDLLINDVTISEQKKQELSSDYPIKTEKEQADFLSLVLCFCMKREFIKRDAKTKVLPTSGMLSPNVDGYLLDGLAPGPCRWFCGRENEITAVHELLKQDGHVFIEGIPGIGKSELAKGYAVAYKKEYTNILYFLYTRNLQQMVTDMDFSDDRPEESDAERFKRHNRFLRSLQQDTLIIIDNFNTVASDEPFLGVLLKYKCKILFTTRSRFNNYRTYELAELSDMESLLALASNFYSEAEKQRTIMEQIIEAVHQHTLAVEMMARLLETGILNPEALQQKLAEQKAAMDATDRIGIVKDGISRKATYYDHLHLLFSLYQLSEPMQVVMRNLSFIPLSGIMPRLFAKWLNMSDMNSVIDLIELGFIRQLEGRKIGFHPMIQEITITDLKPSNTNCSDMIDSIQSVCLRHGEDVPYYKLLFQTIENIIDLAGKDDVMCYLLFLEDAFPYMEKYQYRAGMEKIINEMAGILIAGGGPNDMALLYDYQAAVEDTFHNNPLKAIKLEKDALVLCTEVTADNAHLAANIHANIGYLYHKTNQNALAKQHMEEGMRLLTQYNLLYMNDSVIQVGNYASLISDIGERDKALSALQKCAKIVKDYNSELSSDYAVLCWAMGTICLQMGNVQQATEHFKIAFAAYEVLFSDEPEQLEVKYQEAQKLFVSAGVYIGQQFRDSSPKAYL